MSFFSTSTTLELEPPDFRSDDLTQRSEQLRALLFREFVERPHRTRRAARLP
jgi:hypothetical protein